MVEIPWRPSDLAQFVARFNDAEHDHAGLLVPIVIDGSREERAVNAFITKQTEIQQIVAPSSDEQKALASFVAMGKSDEDLLKELAL
jgi:hypothetical protein